MPAVAVTDHGNMFGAFHFFHEALQNGVRPIIGVEAYIAPGDRRDREAQAASESGDGYAYHLTILAATQKGYRNLVRLVSEAYLTGLLPPPADGQGAPARSTAEGLIGLSGLPQGEVAGRARAGQLRGARKKAFLEYEEIFGKGNFFVEIMDHGLPQQTAIVPDLLRLSTETGRPRRGDQRQPLPEPRRRLRARGPALHRHGQDARGRAADALLQRRVLRQEPRRDEGALRAVERESSSPTPSRSPSAAPVAFDTDGLHLPTFSAPAGPTAGGTFPRISRGRDWSAALGAMAPADPRDSRARSTASGSTTRSASSRRWASRPTS